MFFLLAASPWRSSRNRGFPIRVLRLRRVGQSRYGNVEQATVKYREYQA